MIRLAAAIASLAISGLVFLVAPAVAESFPPVTAEERAMTEVPGQPGAPAVVLFKKAELRIMDMVHDLSSSLDVHVRIKILTDEGREYGEIEVPHSALYRLQKLEGRTVLPDGTEVPLPKDSVFEERTSRTRKSFVTKAAFPAVEAGAIVEYRYSLKWDHPYFFEPWYFHSEIPTLLSEITYDKPGNMALQPWYRETMGKIQSETTKTTRGIRLRVWMERLPPIPDEPNTFPFADLSSRFMVVPTEVMVRGTRWPMFDSWKSVCNTFEETFYGPVRNRSKDARKVAAKLAADAADATAKAAAVYAFVRDEILTSASYGVFVDSTAGVDDVLADRQGTVAEKALMLQAMLKGFGLDPQLVWVGDRTEGRIDLAVANPGWFDKMIVRVELDGEEVFLDPSDRSLGFARLAPLIEGTEALLFHKKKPEVITLPHHSFDDNVRRAVLDLALDGEGRLSGTGSLRLTGHHAWSRLRWKEDEEATVEAWQEWIDRQFEGYESSDVAVEESLDDERLEVTWTLAERREEVLGDEASLEPSRPLGPVKQPFSLPPEQRLTPVQFLFGDRDEVELRLTWPPGWELDVKPESTEIDADVGAVAVALEVDEAARRLTFRRRFDIRGAELVGRDNYAKVRDLFERMEKSDAQELVLVER